MNIFCKDKSNFDLEGTKRQLNIWMNMNYGKRGSEFQYYFVKRKILASPFLGDDIKDYKLYCFNGKPKYIIFKELLNENTHTYIHNFYDLNWKLTDLEIYSSQHIRKPDLSIEKPKNFELMIEYAEKLSKEFVFVRVDLMEAKGILYLTELTFSPFNLETPFKDEAHRIYFGSLIDLTKIKPSLFVK